MLHASAVQEITAARRWVPIPGASPEVPGVVEWRGRAVGVLDVAALVAGIDPLAAGAGRPRTIVVQSEGCLLAVPVDVVTEVREVAEGQLRPARSSDPLLAGTEVDVDGRVLAILDLPALVRRLAGGGAGA